MAQERHAQVVCMDSRMAGMDGVQSTRRLLKEMPHIKIIGLSACFETYTKQQMLAAGASIFMVKADVVEDLIPAIHAVLLMTLNTALTC
jgi:DNA-binding NarL/FixJ family response regulator